MRKFLLFNFLFLPFLAFCDCEACGCCDGIGSIISNAVMGATCSSNCVKITPSECLQLKSDLTGSINNLENHSNSIGDDLGTINGSLSDLRENSDFIISSSSQILQKLDNYPEMPLLDVVNDIDSLNSKIAQYKDNIESKMANTALSNLYTNLTYGTSMYLNFNQRPNIQARIYTNDLSNIKRKINTYYSDLNTYSNQVNTLKSEIRTIVNDIFQYAYGMQSAIGQAESASQNISSEIESINTEISLMRSTVDSITCQSCGNNDNDDDDTPCQTIDVSGIIDAIDNLNERLDYWGNQLKSMMRLFYTDYDTIRKTPISRSSSIDYETYSNQENWFQRVEYLLYSLSDISRGELEGDSSGYPDGAQDLDAYRSESDSKADSEKSELETKSNSMQNSLTTSINRFVNAFNDNSIFAYHDISGQVILSYGSASYGFELVIPSHFGGFARRMNQLFSVFWWIAGILLFAFGFIGLVKLTVKYALWFIKLCSSTFG